MQTTALTAPCSCSHSNVAANLRKSSFLKGTRLCVATAPACPPQKRARQLQVNAGKGKGKQSMRGGGAPQQPQVPPTPPVDPDNAEFVLFVRSKKLPQWLPLSIVKGGSQANVLVKSLESEWGKKVFGKTLVRNLAAVVYQDQPQMEKMIRTQFPPLKNATEFEYGFKVRDKSNPKNWYVAEDITIFPAKEELGTTVVDNVRSFFQGKLQEAKRGY
ncbi:hypothetical protein WJX72_009453 [[Myrmecia] bisecta]|uniref:Uncharacterized protein n=1 Tax=[Myrmecia] bisecta TaxID=41462 RepID=A0AAW1PX06_9CHLO